MLFKMGVDMVNFVLCFPFLPSTFCFLSVEFLLQVFAYDLHVLPDHLRNEGLGVVDLCFSKRTLMQCQIGTSIGLNR